MKHILVVDDDPSILEVIKLILEIKGYKVSTLQTGVKVLETAINILPDLILLDILLGGTNGIDICADLKASSNTKNIPVIIISANSSIESIFLTCEANAYIQKPFNIADIISIIEAELNKGIK